MGRMKELAEQVAELKRCGEILIDISENMTQMFSAKRRQKSSEGRTKRTSCTKGRKEGLLI